MDEAPIPDDAEARRFAGLLLFGEAGVGRLRERLNSTSKIGKRWRSTAWNWGSSRPGSATTPPLSRAKAAKT